ncbi:hypothetical protein I203_108589 [Kwoniella mangroviensis CBS 8507]|uniref:hypothetical protein n=1 Tax=Kwoniella mangroviensis CBS 8507 TaxID=1296122 RepID=UPI00080D128A|nr:uncharacterized protein I203_08008 [Kwoniella mangroviensis CBS 8507]OCF62874.1 hypothetical protein I203_08008 [Kwoniella mangroviensis CBS 8507]
MSSPSSHTPSPALSEDAVEQSDRPVTPTPEDVAAYQQLMSCLFPPSSLPPPPAQPASTPHDEDDDKDVVENGVTRPMTKAEKQNAKKKRRKERERLAKAEAESEVQAKSDGRNEKKDEGDAVVRFKLFSTCPLQDVSITTSEEDYPSIINPRYLPLPAETSTKVHCIATESAIEVEHLTHPSSSRGHSSCTSVPLKTFAVNNSGMELPPMFVGTVSRHSRLGITNKDETQSKSFSTPMINLKDTSHNVGSRASVKKTTRRGRRKRPTVQARFWAPSPGLGGKARGYAWGYRDSMEGRREVGAWEGYVRSKDR